jgi:hypothetical protein
MSKRRGDKWADAAFAWALLDDRTARVIIWVDEGGVPRIVARSAYTEVNLLPSPHWETVAELLMRASLALRADMVNGGEA